MTTKTILAALALCTATGVAFGQASSPSRAEVKAETKEAAKKGELTPAGSNQKADDAVRAQSSKKTSTTTRSNVKAESKAAAASDKGDLSASGGDPKPSGKKSSKTRAERKSETSAAAKNRQLTPAGEGQDTPKK